MLRGETREEERERRGGTGETECVCPANGTLIAINCYIVRRIDRIYEWWQVERADQRRSARFTVNRMRQADGATVSLAPSLSLFRSVPLRRSRRMSGPGPAGPSPSRDVSRDKLSYLLVFSVYMSRRALPATAPSLGWLSTMVGPHGIQWEPVCTQWGIRMTDGPERIADGVGTSPQRRIRVTPDRRRLMLGIPPPLRDVITILTFVFVSSHFFLRQK